MKNNMNAVDNNVAIRSNEEGAALLFVLVIATAILWIGSLATYVSMSGRMMAAENLHSKIAFYCAESALEQKRKAAAENETGWNTVLAGGTAAWYTEFQTLTPCANATVYSYRGAIRDNVDEMPPAANNNAADTDSMVIVDVEVLFAEIPVARLSGIVLGLSSTSGGAPPGFDPDNIGALW